jgi:hypothetical protein
MVKLGIDIGLKNYAYCLLDDEQQVLEWECVDLTQESKCGSTHYKGKFDMIHVSKTLFEKFKYLFEKYDKGRISVNIENQIPTGSNGIIMKTIQGMTTQILTVMGVTDMNYVGGSKKLKKFDVPQKTYKERKKGSILVVRELVGEALDRFGKKKDDVCDAYLLCLF